MAYDASRDRVVRYGGFGGPLGQTWEWDGSQWQQIFPPVSPPVRDTTTMVYDPHNELVILFGGGLGGTIYNDLWEWDGSTWTERVTEVRPPPRFEHAMAYDEIRRCVVLFGGKTPSSAYYDDTWIWDGTSWQEVAPKNRPRPRGFAGMAYDRARGRVVMFGGIIDAIFFPLWSDETWEWDGADWEQHQPAVRPLPRAGVRLAYDHRRRTTIAFGGVPTTIGQAFSDTWAWDGQRWTRLATIGPPGRGCPGMVYDSARGRVLVHGGAIGFQFGVLRYKDLWALDSTLPHFFPQPGRDRIIVDR